MPDNRRALTSPFWEWTLLIVAIVASLGAGSCAQVNSDAASTSAPTAQSKIVFIPNAVDFSNVVLGQKNTQTVKMSNEGTKSIQVSSIHVAGTGFGITGLTFPFSLEPHVSRTFNIEFTPKSVGLVAGTLTIESSLVASETLNIKGVGTNALPKLQTNPASINFGTLAVEGTAAQTITISNTGNASLTVNQVVVSGSGFSVSGLPLQFQLAPQQQTSFLVSFHPTAMGSAKGSLKFLSKELSAPLTVSLAGVGGDVSATSSGSDHTVILSWDASVSKIMGYYVYRGQLSGGPYTRITASAVKNLKYSDTNVNSGQEYFYVVTSVDNSGQESFYSEQISATIPNP